MKVFFRRAVAEVGSGVPPRNENALEVFCYFLPFHVHRADSVQNLTAFLCAVFTKKYTNPNTDVIEVLAGLDTIDRLMSDLVHGLESIIRQANKPSFRTRALETTLALVAGGFHTSLISYFIHRDLFSALMKVSSSVPMIAATYLGVVRP